jgi:predicted ester cyclase
MPVRPSSCIFCQIGSSESSTCRPSRIRICTGAERAAFEGLHYDIHHAVADGNLVVVNSTMNGRHIAPWAVYAEDGSVDTVFPPTGRTFAMTQSHWFLLEDGRIIDHWANRDDLGMARQLGWIPPSPAFLFKMARAKRRALRTPTPDPPDPHPSGGVVCPCPRLSGVRCHNPISRRSAAVTPRGRARGRRAGGR